MRPLQMGFAGSKRRAKEKINKKEKGRKKSSQIITTPFLNLRMIAAQ
jgi:hypothetical protein